MTSPDYAPGTKFGIRAFNGDTNLADLDVASQTMRDDIEEVLLGYPQHFTVLPTTGPFSGPLLDGQRIIFIADATNGVLWHLRYNASSSSTHKWEFLGGAAIRTDVTLVAGTNTWTLAVPLAGDYDVTYGIANAPVTFTSTPNGIGLTCDSAIVTTYQALQHHSPDQYVVSGANTVRVTGLAAGHSLSAQSVSINPAAGDLTGGGDGFIIAKPVRVG